MKGGARLASFVDDMEPPPADFDEVYARFGWDQIERHYQVHAIKAARWINERGRERLKVLRAEYVRAKRRRACRYVLGRTRTAVKPDAGEA